VIGVVYRVAGQLVKPLPELVDTPFVAATVRIGRRHLLRGLLLGRLDVTVTVDADDDTLTAVTAVLDPAPIGDTLMDAAARLKTAQARVRAARRDLDRLLDAATAQ